MVSIPAKRCRVDPIGLAAYMVHQTSQPTAQPATISTARISAISRFSERLTTPSGTLVLPSAQAQLSSGLSINLALPTVNVQLYYLYIVMDGWSRCILGGEAHDHESGELAKRFSDRVRRDEEMSPGRATILYSDNGAWSTGGHDLRMSTTLTRIEKQREGSRTKLEALRPSPAGPRLQR